MSKPRLQSRSRHSKTPCGQSSRAASAKTRSAFCSTGSVRRAQCYAMKHFESGFASARQFLLTLSLHGCYGARTCQRTASKGVVVNTRLGPRGGVKILLAGVFGVASTGLFGGEAWGIQTTSFHWLAEDIAGQYNSRSFEPTMPGSMSTASEQCWGYLDVPTSFNWSNSTMQPSVQWSSFRSGSWTEQLTLETPWYEPDINRGQHTFTCDYFGQPYQWAYFGPQPASGETYHFSFVSSSYWNSLDGGLNAQGYMGFQGS
jgi:hypothetical protein